MPDDKDRDLNAEDQAALDYERSQEENAEKRARRARLRDLFYKTPAMVEHVEQINAIQDSSDWNNQTICIEVAKPLLAMLEYEERAEAAEIGRAPSPVAAILARIVDNVLQEELHWHVVEPVRWERLRKLWNDLCDQKGMPEEKLPGPTDPSEQGGEGPF